MSIQRKLKSWMFKLPMMLNCAEAEEFFHDHHEEALPAAKRWRLNLHLKLCRECTSYYSAYKNTIALEKAAYQDAEPAEALSPDLVARITTVRNNKNTSP